MTLHTLPHLKPSWKEFKQETETLALDEAMEKYPGLEVIEYIFITFIEQGNIVDEEMIKVMDAHKALDHKNLKREYYYTEEELRYYLISRLMNRMVSKLNALGDVTPITPDGASTLVEVRDLVPEAI